MSLFDMKFFSFIGIKKKPKAPWKKFYTKEEFNLEVEDVSIYEFIKRKMIKYKDYDAIEFYGTTYTYREFLKKIDVTAKAFKSQGIRKGDIVTILSANIPEALFSFYALNKIGAVANMLHPLLSENEIKDALKRYSTVMVVAMDICYEKLNKIIDDTEVYKTIIISAKDSMSPLMKIGYEVTQGYKVKKPKKSQFYVYWKDFIRMGEKYKGKDIEVKALKDTPALILQSGGSTGNPKGIVLSNGNFNAATVQSRSLVPEVGVDDVALAIMPIFHGFGLSVNIHDAFFAGAKVVLIPTFKASEFDKLVKKYKPTVMVGVPTLFEALTTNKGMKDVNLNYLKYTVAGGDSFNHERVNKINDFLHSHGAKTNFTQGYGMTEALAAVSFDIMTISKPGTVGIPLPGNYIQICKPGSDEEVPYGEEGEICICGPTVMLGYYDNEKETNEALHIHKDGNVWLHSGDLGVMDKDGYITFKQRIKRMIVSSGYNVYPAQIEEVLEKHEAVLDCSVIGIPHPYKVEVAKAYIALKDGYRETSKLRAELLELCKANLAAYSIPKEFEFRKSLPKTMIGKVDFKKLQQENIEARAKEKEEQDGEKLQEGKTV